MTLFSVYIRDLSNGFYGTKINGTEVEGVRLLEVNLVWISEDKKSGILNT